MKRLLASGLIILGAGAAGLLWLQDARTSNDQSVEVTMHDADFFETPKIAVEAVKGMLKKEDWVSLARYYDLSGSGIDRASLVSGEFFIRTERPEASHPGGFWRYKHPFAPSFNFSFTTQSNEADIVVVRVGITIDQGAGEPAQEGWQEFLMRKSEAGFQILPGDAGSVDRAAPTLVSPSPSLDLPKD